MRDVYKDGVIDELIDNEATLLDHVVDITTERAAFRLLALTAIARLHDQDAELVRLRKQLAALRGEIERHTAKAVAPERSVA